MSLRDRSFSKIYISKNRQKSFGHLSNNFSGHQNSPQRFMIAALRRCVYNEQRFASESKRKARDGEKHVMVRNQARQPGIIFFSNDQMYRYCKLTYFIINFLVKNNFYFNWSVHSIEIHFRNAAGLSRNK